MKKANPNTIFSVMEDIKEGLKDASIKAGIEHPVVYVEHPYDISHCVIYRFIIIIPLTVVF